MFTSVFQALKPTAETMVRWAQYSRNGGSTSDCSQIMFTTKTSLINQFFLFLCFLTAGLMEKDLSFRYHISPSTTSRIILTWANYLYFVLGSLPIWPSREKIDHYMPDCFKDLYPKCRVIIDCTEIKCQTPSANVRNSMFYSSYKNHTTFKGLLGIAPFGAVTFVSELYSGLISDKEITARSGIVSLLDANDSVMMDKGFRISDLLEKVPATYAIPPFLTSKRKQFEENEVAATQNIARVRIHVERAIRRVKENHLFDRVIQLSLAGSINQLWTVACLLTSFRGPLF